VVAHENQPKRNQDVNYLTQKHFKGLDVAKVYSKEHNARKQPMQCYDGTSQAMLLE